MPPQLSKPSGAAPAALFYITLGAIMTVWSGIWFIYLKNNPPSRQWVSYLCTGFVVTGIVLLAIGFTLGPISRWSRRAELPPEETLEPTSQSEQADTISHRVV